MTETENPKILVVDDKPQNLYAMERLLRPLDITLITTTTGEQALGLTLEHDFCLAIVDVQMPEMDGYELVELLRGNRGTASLPIIFVSAIFSDEYHHRKGYDAGAVDFLSKPFVPEILLAKVNVFLELYHQRRALQSAVTQLNQANTTLAQFNEALEAQVQARTAELQQTHAKLERLDRAKTDFIRVAAHELRTPLSLVRGYADMLKTLTEENPEAHKLVEGVLAGGARMLEVLNSLLDMTRLGSGAVPLYKEPVHLFEIFEPLTLTLEPDLAERHLTLTVANIARLPMIDGDVELLNKLFTQIVLNAIKYTPDGGTITINAHAIDTPTGPQVEVLIHDTGIGIAPEHHELIFEKFFQTSSAQLHSTGRTKFKGGGPGLGLAIARGIAELHGGRIWAESPGHDEAILPGSTFHICLPIGA